METTVKPERIIRVLVVDDSAAGRAVIAEILGQIPSIEIVGRAMDGSEALAMVHRLKPDLMTLDLEMPRMDGFTLLRMLRVQHPMPVIVVSSDSRPEASIQALELGALDFVVKPTQLAGAPLGNMGQELLSKIQALVGVVLREPAPIERRPPGSVTLSAVRILPEQVGLVVIGASTGGPIALQSILSAIPGRLRCAMVVAQHMPTQFTRAFADRLDRTLHHRVREALDGDLLLPGEVLIAPGGKRTTVGFNEHGRLVTKVTAPAASDAFAPSIDVLFETAAACVGRDLVAVVLTGMGADGAQGVRAVDELGGSIVTESPETALIPGMPEEARRAVKTARSLRLDQIARLLWQLGRATA
ncbi:MAG: chemotaxis-specific protein-glutamate methyltransferase CheB [Deltaproteobacteria bacterium]|nr:chemotaxis-specific protein-glutamate methyltransferase CheB [Deltaproteobacteria bacterium]